MATGEALICKLKNIAPIEGADNIVQANMFGETIITQKQNKESDLGLLIDCESILSEEFCRENNLFRHNNLNKDTTITGYFEDNPRVRPIKLRKVKCSAFWIPIDSLDYISKDRPQEGTQINEWKGHEICKKYVRPIKHIQGQQKQKKIQQVLNFFEHLDTDQLLRNLHKIQIGDKIIVTSKLHGTSCRVGLLPTIDLTWKSRLLHFLGIETKNKYAMVVGSRHTLKHVENQKIENKDSYYPDDIWTESAYKYFHGKLIPGETVYYEIVGYLPSGQPIMPTYDNSKLKKFLEDKEYKEFIKKFGQTTTFHYRCYKDRPTYIDNNHRGLVKKSEYKIFVYRITLTTEHGQAIDLSFSQIQNRCDQLGVNCVSKILSDLITKENISKYQDEQFWLNLTEQDDKDFPTHLNEGIVARLETPNLRPELYKSKRYCFKVLEGIIKDSAQFADIEESN